MKNISLIIVLFFVFTSQGQIFIKGKLEGGTVINCQGLATCSQLNAPVGSQLDLLSTSLGTPITQNLSFSDTVSGLCEDSWYGIDGRYMLTAANGDTLATSVVYPPNFDYVITGYTAPSSPVSNDGTLTITFPSPLVFGFPPNGPNTIYAGDGITGINASTSDNLTFTLLNLREGKLYIYVDYQDDELSIEGYIGDYENSIVNNNLAVDINIIDTDSTCNGSAELIPDPSATGLTYTWSEINYNGLSNVTNMCEGVYRVLVEDATGDNKLLEFLITDSTYTFIDPWNNQTNPADTLNLILAACNIDYTLPIDSISWSETLLSVNGDTSFYNLDLVLYQGLNAVVFTNPYYLTTDTLVTISCGFYCESFKVNGFNGFKVFLSRDGTQQSYVLGTEENSLNPIRIYPNPSDDRINLQGCDEADLYDLFGKKVMHLTEGSNDTNVLEPGTYLLKNGNACFKVIIL